jgi:hypothetical protein
MRIRAQAHGHNLPKVDQHLTAVFVVLDMNVLPLGSILLDSISYVSSEQFSTISSELMNGHFCEYAPYTRKNDHS